MFSNVPQICYPDKKIAYQTLAMEINVQFYGLQMVILIKNLSIRNWRLEIQWFVLPLHRFLFCDRCTLPYLHRTIHVPFTEAKTNFDFVATDRPPGQRYRAEAIFFLPRTDPRIPADSKVLRRQNCPQKNENFSGAPPQTPPARGSTPGPQILGPVGGSDSTVDHDFMLPLSTETKIWST